MVTSNKRVLVVDDEPVVCESYKRVLTDAGYAVSTATSGRDALAACRESRFDVVLTDLKMPDMNGLEVTEKVRTQQPQAQVVIITGYPTEQSAQEARGLGVFGYLQKPLSPESLAAATAAAADAPAVKTAAAKPVAESAPAVKPAAVKQPEPVTVREESTLQTLALFAAAPVISIAYIMLLPIIGFGMLFAVVGGGLAKKVGLMKS